MGERVLAWTFERLAGPVGDITEGPAWDGSGLLFTDISNDQIMRYDPETGAYRVFRTGTNGANGLMLDRHGRLYACEGKGAGRRVVRYEADGSVTALAAQFEGKRLNSPNDLAIDVQGRVWFTDPGYGLRDEDRELDHDSVYRLTPPAAGNGPWSIERMTVDTTKPNGLLIAADEATLYVAQSDHGETALRELRAYPIRPDGHLGTYRVLHQFGAHRGIDGMCLDTEGNIVAATGYRHGGPGPAIMVFAPDGEVLERHPFPEDRPTNCTFGDRDLQTLYVTNIGGSLYRARTERRGRLWWPPEG
jgi:gluconolactonase